MTYLKRREHPVTTVQIPDDLARQYQDRARAAGCDVDVFVREALIAKLEDMEDAEIAMERLANPQPVRSLEEVKNSLGLDD
jgi:predicted DNA-binding protein